MADYNVNDRVEVRGAGAHAFRAGTVTAKELSRWQVTLDSPVNANAWGGRTRKYAGANQLSVVYIYKNAEVLDPGVYIKVEGA